MRECGFVGNGGVIDVIDPDPGEEFRVACWVASVGGKLGDCIKLVDGLASSVK